MMQPDWQPTLTGSTIALRPLTQEDLEPLFAAASDPLIWEQHPDRERYTRERFEMYFRSGMASRGALAIVDRTSGAMIGCSRFMDYSPIGPSIEVGFTFFIRRYWGTGYNRELKSLMLDYAFGFVNRVVFDVGKENHRSRKALSNIGASEVLDPIEMPVHADLETSVIYQIKKSDWEKKDVTLLG